MRHTIIIAEAGVNHNGSLENAKKLVDAAAAAGVDYVKFQTFNANKIASKAAAKAAYQQTNTGNADSQVDMLRKLELSEQDHYVLLDYCKEKGIRFLSTPFDLESIDLLKKLGITLGKIPSGELTNLPYLRKMGQSFQEIVMSTGMADLQEVLDAMQVLLDVGVKKECITILHCNTQYPTPMQDVNLRAMEAIREAAGVATGYSDHTLGIEVPIAAVAMGAVLIEKHFTLDSNMEGPDHRASLEPRDLIAMVTAIRNIEKALGDGVKQTSPSEIENMAIVRKSIVASRVIAKGEHYTEDNLTVKRPGTGISGMEWDRVIGQVAPRDFEEDEMITL
ncbi:N-acetylneuraminate synthase [Chitinophaga costaii]|uniref:N-acetylneuraminate synthase n=1 Tax=Chitinophaga costaii TaxID=1335309 RepID=A0A1C4F6E3_9BACT|nr:N-acetylneuraminate synthase [Chitinophaga costaii]PUZ21239.1 N-acetylneuraminate synthase [Chitinophaga costaii]SCC51577.1 N-acetylneuraminate synthase [Chitinophaga costaii]